MWLPQPSEESLRSWVSSCAITVVSRPTTIRSPHSLSCDLLWPSWEPSELWERLCDSEYPVSNPSIPSTTGIPLSHTNYCHGNNCGTASTRSQRQRDPLPFKPPLTMGVGLVVVAVVPCALVVVEIMRLGVRREQRKDPDHPTTSRVTVGLFVGLLMTARGGITVRITIGPAVIRGKGVKPQHALNPCRGQMHFCRGNHWHRRNGRARCGCDPQAKRGVPVPCSHRPSSIT